MKGAEISYHLGVDLGTTYTAAAVWRDRRIRVVRLGNRAPVVPSVLLLTADGEWLVGESAEWRAPVETNRVAREFKRRVGDPTPLVLGTWLYSPEDLMARLLCWVVDRVTAMEGAPPTTIAVSHPANWGEFKTDRLREAIDRASLPGVVFVTEPEAAAIHYATQERIEPGEIVAVYDFGGGTFDAAVLRRTATGWEILGRPQGIEHLGGIDFDEAVFQHVLSGWVAEAVDELDPGDRATRAALARLRQECVAAKEALAADTDVAIPVLLPNHQTGVRLTRAEFEDMIRPTLSDTVTALRFALRAAEVTSDDLSRVLLVGGSSRIPLVAQVVGAELGRPVAVDVHPKHAVALGAARVAVRTPRSVRVPAVTTRRPGPPGAPPAAAMAPRSGSRGVPPAAAVVPGSGSPGAVSATMATPRPGPASGIPAAGFAARAAAAPAPPTYGAQDATESAGWPPEPVATGVGAPIAPPRHLARRRRRRHRFRLLLLALAALLLVGAGTAAALSGRLGLEGLPADPLTSTTRSTTPTTQPPLAPATGTAGTSGTVSVPDLVGSEVEQALSVLRLVGLQIEIGPEATPDGDQVGLIVGQNLPAGTEVVPGTTVSVAVGVPQ